MHCICLQNWQWGHTANYGEQEIGAVVAGGASALQTLNSGMSNTEIAKELGSKMVTGGAGQLENMALMALDATIAPDQDRLQWRYPEVQF